MSTSAEEERKAKQAARQAKLLAKSNERLAKITGAAKGEGRFVSDSAVGIAKQPPSSPTPAVVPTIKSRPDTPTLTDAFDDPAEVDLGASTRARVAAGQMTPQQAQLAQIMGGIGGGSHAQNPSAPEGMDMFQQMMASMAGGGQQQQQQQAMAGSANGGLPQPPVSPFPPVKKTALDKLFPIIHLVAMVGVALWSIFVLEPEQHPGVFGLTWFDHVDWNAWASLGTRSPSVATNASGQGIAAVPVLWTFVTVELVLQTSRIFLTRNRAQPPTLLNTLLPMVSQFSPQLAVAVQTGAKYFALLTIMLNDLAVLIFTIGVMILFARYRVGVLNKGLGFIAGEESIGWNEPKVEL